MCIYLDCNHGKLLKSRLNITHHCNGIFGVENGEQQDIVSFLFTRPEKIDNTRTC